MREIIIDEEFKALLPSLDAETYARLEENILEHGCREAIVLWNDIIVDGHNRFAICTEHEIPYKTVDMEFGSREEAVIWIITTQVSRRNLTPMQMSYYRGLHYRANKQLKGRPKDENKMRQNDAFIGATRNQLAEQYKVSPKTIERDAKFSESIDAISSVSPDARRQILSGGVVVSKTVLGSIPTMLAEEIEELAMSIEEGNYKKRSAPAELEPYEIVAAMVRRLEKEFAKITEELFSELNENTEADDDTPELKTAIRSYIDMLEKLYKII